MKTEPKIVMIHKEYMIFHNQMKWLLPYRGVTNINDLRNIFKFYCKIASGHKKRATDIYSAMDISLRLHLPLKIFQYINGNDELATYSEWKRKGFQVRKGEKHVFRKIEDESHTNFKLGECLFSRKQVDEIKYNQPPAPKRATINYNQLANDLDDYYDPYIDGIDRWDDDWFT